MRILITGGAGFVGSTIAIHLKSEYQTYEVISLDNLKRRGSEINVRRLQDQGIQFIHGDVRNNDDLSFTEQLDVIIDASAEPSVLAGIQSSVAQLINTNLFGTSNCLELANRHKATFIFLSTSRVYPIKTLEECKYKELETRFVWEDHQEIGGISSKGVTEAFPLEGSRSFYGASKLASELLITEYNSIKELKTVINRCGIISGPWQMGRIDQGVLVLWLAHHYFKRELSYIGYGGGGKQLRDVLHVDDLFRLIDHQIHNIDKYSGQTLNVGGGSISSFSLLELTRLCQEVTGNKVKTNSIKENRVADIRIYVSDYTKLCRLSGWYPQKDIRTLVEGTFKWINNNEKELKNILY